MASHFYGERSKRRRSVGARARSRRRKLVKNGGLDRRGVELILAGFALARPLLRKGRRSGAVAAIGLVGLVVLGLVLVPPVALAGLAVIGRLGLGGGFRLRRWLRLGSGRRLG